MRLRSASFGLTMSALVLAGCGDGDDGDSAATPDTSAAEESAGEGTTAMELPEGARYVALGSSFAAGPGIEPQGPECGRSGRNYANLVTAELDLELVDVTCSGATTANVIDTPQDAAPPQGDAVTAETALVTVTVGGNDLGYAATTFACGDPATTCTAAQAAQEDQYPALRQSLTRMFDLLRQRAPEATIVLVTYPVLVPAETCAQLMYTPEEAAIVRTVGERLQETFLDVAADAGILVADPYSADGDHGPCAPEGDRWVNGNTGGDGVPYHPDSTGHQAMADLVLEALAG